MRKIDEKYSVVSPWPRKAEEPEIVKTDTGEALPVGEPLFLFRAKDKLVLEMLNYYHQLCREAQCTPEHTAGAFHMIRQAEKFAREHPERMKVPD